MISAFLFFAESKLSNTNIPAPSPRTSPSLSLENGRHLLGDKTLKLSQGFIPPKFRKLSAPPVIIISDFLYLMVSYAKPIAWFAEEHAEDTVKLGPCIWNSIEIKLVAELFMIFGMVRGCNLLCPSS